MEDQLEMARDAVGSALWEELADSEREKLLAAQIWKKEVLENWQAERDAAAQKAAKGKLKKKGRRRAAAAMEDEDEDDGY
jgi:hypothetical protein